MKAQLIILSVLILSCSTDTGWETYYDDESGIKVQTKEEGDLLHIESYYNTGELHFTCNARIDNEEPEKEYFEYYKNGNLKIDGYFEKGGKQGVEKWYHENQTIWKLIEFNNEFKTVNSNYMTLLAQQ
jgi:antitoxin component YwqK of YwqJK toxin-antitoxin module